MTTDTRIVYGATCRWWDSIDKASSTDGSGLPCCPICGGVLFEVPTAEAWWRDVDDFEADGHPGYRELLEFTRGKCYKSMDAATAAWERSKRTGTDMIPNEFCDPPTATVLACRDHDAVEVGAHCDHWYEDQGCCACGTKEPNLVVLGGDDDDG